MYKHTYSLATGCLLSMQENKTQHPKTKPKPKQKPGPAPWGNSCTCEKKINNEGFHSNPSSVVQIDDFHSVLLYNQRTDILLKVLGTSEVILLKSLVQTQNFTSSKLFTKVSEKDA